MSAKRHVRLLEPSRFGTLLKDCRVAAGLTQEELAEQAGVSVRCLSDLERGISRTPQKATLERLAGALQLPAEERADFKTLARLERIDSAARDTTLPERQQSHIASTHAYRSGVVRSESGTTVSLRDGSRSTDLGRRILRPIRSPTSLILPRRRFVPFLALVLVMSLALLVHKQTSSTGSSSSLAGSFMSWGPQPVSGAMRAPSSVAIDPYGNLLVADTGNNRIEKFDPTGAVLAVWGGSGTGPGRFRAPRSLVSDARGHIFVLDAGHFQVQELSSTGRLLQAWPWKFPGSLATALGIDHRDQVYLLDVGHRCIYVLMGSDGLPYWCPASESEYASAFAFDIHGGLYVTTVTGTVIKPTSFGEAAHRSPVLWRVPGSAHRTDIRLEGMAVDSHGNIVVTDGTHDHIWKLSPLGKQIAVWGSRGTRPGQYLHPRGLTLDRRGNIVVADAGNNRIQRLSRTGTLLDELSRPRSVFRGARSITVDRFGNVYVLTGDTATRLKKFSRAGRLLSDWGSTSFGIQPGSTYFLSGVAVDSHDAVYVADTLNDRIDKVSPTGSLLAQWTTSHESGGFLTPFGVTVDAQDHVYVVDTGHSRVVELSSAGRFLGSIGTIGNNGSIDIGTLAHPQSVAVDVHGNLFVADTGANRIVVFSPDGHVIRYWETRGSSREQWSEPVSIAVDRLSTVYVADSHNSRIDHYSSQGTLLTEWGNRGSGPGQFREPDGVAVDGWGDVYAADTGNDRIQKLAANG